MFIKITFWEKGQSFHRMRLIKKKTSGEWAKQMAIFRCLLPLSSEGNFTAINSFQSYVGICWKSDWFAIYFWIFLREHRRYSLLCKRTLHWLNRKMYKSGIYWYLWKTDLCIWQFLIAVREANVLKPRESFLPIWQGPPCTSLPTAHWHDMNVWHAHSSVTGWPWSDEIYLGLSPRFFIRTQVSEYILNIQALHTFWGHLWPCTDLHSKKTKYLFFFPIAPL